jgi:hypothetical protein
MISTGDPGLDECLDGGYQQGALHLVVGGTGSGKTSWLRTAIRSALNAGKTVHIVDQEGSLRSFQGEPHCSISSSISEPLLPDQGKIDLLVYDDAHLLHTAQELGVARWVTSFFVPNLRLLEHPVKLVSWQARAALPGSLGVPKALNFSADVVLHLHRAEDSRDIRAILRKNRFGLTGQEFGYSLPEVRPIIRRTIWERLQTEPV